MRMARGSWSSLSSHGKRLGPQEALKKDSRGLSRVAAGAPGQVCVSLSGRQDHGRPAGAPQRGLAPASGPYFPVVSSL